MGEHANAIAETRSKEGSRSLVVKRNSLAWPVNVGRFVVPSFFFFFFFLFLVFSLQDCCTVPFSLFSPPRPSAVFDFFCLFSLPVLFTLTPSCLALESFRHDVVLIRTWQAPIVVEIRLSRGHSPTLYAMDCRPCTRDSP